MEAGVAAAEVAAGNDPPPRRAGFRTHAAENKLIEKHAMRVARAYYRTHDWSVTELGKPV